MGTRKRKTDQRQPTNAPEDLEPIWKYRGLDKTRFYAAAHFVAYCRPCGIEVGQSNICNTEEYIQTLLDAVALLFARFKAIRPFEDAKELESNISATVKNVSAASIEFDSEGRKLAITIAKNGGPQQFDNNDDNNFAESIAHWYNDNTQRPPAVPSSSDSIWLSMCRYWDRRLAHYVYTFHKKREQLEPITQALIKPHGPIALASKSFTFNMDQVNDELQLIGDLMARNDIGKPSFMRYICWDQKFDSIGREYPKYLFPQW